METKPLFSIVIPIYNAEKYLEESIISVCCQNIGFEQNIQLVLVNDGSSDASCLICEKYKELYPENIIYYTQTNSGVSVARNKGVELATGQFIGFLDADDKFSRGSLKAVSQYFNIVRDYVDVAVIRVLNFGAQSNPYYLNPKFSKGTRTIDLQEADWYDACMRVGQAFFRAEVAKRHYFDPEVTYFEDTKYINEVLSEKRRLGIVKDGIYYYRRYGNENDPGTSLTTGAAQNKRLYMETPRKVTLAMLEHIGTAVPIYYQYVALAEMRWRTFYSGIAIEHVLNGQEYQAYKELRKTIFQYVSNEAIIKCGIYNFWQKLYLLSIKNNEKNILDKLTLQNDSKIFVYGFELYDLKNQLQVNLLNSQIENDILKLEGYLPCLLIEGVEIVIQYGGISEKVVFTEKRMSPTGHHLEFETYQYPMFSVVIPLKEKCLEVRFISRIGEEQFGGLKIYASKLGNDPDIVKKNRIQHKFIVRRREDSLKIYKINLCNVLRLSFKAVTNKQTWKKVKKKIVKKIVPQKR